LVAGTTTAASFRKVMFNMAKTQKGKMNVNVLSYKRRKRGYVRKTEKVRELYRSTPN